MCIWIKKNYEHHWNHCIGLPAWNTIQTLAKHQLSSSLAIESHLVLSSVSHTSFGMDVYTCGFWRVIKDLKYLITYLAKKDIFYINTQTHTLTQIYIQHHMNMSKCAYCYKHLWENFFSISVSVCVSVCGERIKLNVYLISNHQFTDTHTPKTSSRWTCMLGLVW